MRNYLLPTEHNGYQPHLLSKAAFAFYAITLLVINFLYPAFFSRQVQAAVDFETLVYLHNQERERFGLAELKINSALNASATAKAEAMLASDCWSHYCPTGKSPWSFFDEADYNYVYAGENLAEGFEENADVMTAWLNSPTHRSNILNDKFQEIGVGFASGTFQGIENNTIIVIHFGTRVSEHNDSTPPQQEETPLQLLEPANGSYLNTSFPIIAGASAGSYQLYFYDNSNEIGSIVTGGGTFTFKPTTPLSDGTHALEAHAYNDTSLIEKSNTLQFTVDTLPPVLHTDEIALSSLITDNNTQKAIIKVSSDITINTIQTNPPSSFSLNTTSGFWEIEINVNELKNSPTIELTAIDKAQNKASLEVETQTLVADIEKVALEQELETNRALSLKRDNTQKSLNLVFTFMISGLIILDISALQKLGLTGLKRSKSHLHLGALLIIFCVSMVGGFSGDILIGLQTT